MLKSLALIALLVSPALADEKTTKLGFTLTAGKDTRHYALSLVSDSCGNVAAHSPQVKDEIKVCLKPSGPTDLRLEIEWKTRHDDYDLENRSTVIATRGKSFELDGGSAKLAVAVQ